MSSRNDRQRSANNVQSLQHSHRSATGPLQELPGLVTQLSPVEQVAFPDSPPSSSNHSQPLQPLQSSQALVTSEAQQSLERKSVMFSPVTPPSAPEPTSSITRQLPFNASPNVTRALATLEKVVTTTKGSTPTSRQPVLIRGTGKKRPAPEPIQPPRKRRWIINLAVTAVVLLISVITLMTVIPAGNNGETGFNPFRPIVDWAKGNSNASNLRLLAQQAATVTAVTRDGYEAGGGNHASVTYPGLPPAPPGSSGSDNFTYGQCTYYADMRYHQLTGFWVPWGGNANQWAAGAAASGWNVSSQPHVPSIIVLQAGVQGAGGFGHVAVVESINSNGSVHVSQWNWYAGGGGWAVTSYWDFFPGPGVSFVWR